MAKKMEKSIWKQVLFDRENGEKNFWRIFAAHAEFKKYNKIRKQYSIMITELSHSSATDTRNKLPKTTIEEERVFK